MRVVVRSDDELRNDFLKFGNFREKGANELQTVYELRFSEAVKV